MTLAIRANLGDHPATREPESAGEMAAGLSRALGREVRYNDGSPDVHRDFGLPRADDPGKIQFNHDFAEDLRRH